MNSSGTLVSAYTARFAGPSVEPSFVLHSKPANVHDTHEMDQRNITKVADSASQTRKDTTGI